MERLLNKAPHFVHKSQFCNYARTDSIENKLEQEEVDVSNAPKDVYVLII
jgi:hypothetical protein